MSEPEPSLVEKPKSRGWLIGIGLLCVALLLYVAMQADPIADLAVATGYYLFFVLIVAAGVWLFSRNARRHKAAVILAFFASLLVGNYLGVLRERQQTTAFLDEIQQATNAYEEQINATTEEGLPKPMQIQPAVTRAEGDFGVAELVSKQLLNDFAAARNAYLSELEGAGWYGLLDVKRLKGDPSFVESRLILKRTEAIIKKHREHSFSLIEQMLQRVKEAHFSSESVRASMLQGMERTVPTSRANAKQLWDYESAVIEEMRSIVDLLERRRGYYEVSETNILFEREADLEAFNQHLQAIERIGEQQAVLQQQIQSDASAKLEQARNE